VAKFVFLESSPVVQALYDAGVLDEDFENVRRLVIDLEVGA